MDFRILGPLEVLQDGRPVRLRGAKERAALALLLLRANEPVPVDRLVDDLWGDRPPVTARKSLQVRIAALRRALPDGVLATEGGGYAIHVVADELDLRRFERLVGEGRTALDLGAPGDAAAILREALELWRGPALADFTSEPFAQAPIARLEELRLAAIELRIDADLALGRSAEAAAELEELVAAHPFRERLRAQLMLALYREGRQAEALDLYRRSRALLVSELGIEPGPALKDLERAILEHDPSLDRRAATERERSILVAVREGSPALLDLAASLATRPRREVILAQLVPPAGNVTEAARALEERRQALMSRAVAARGVAFTSDVPGDDLVRVALEQDVDLVVFDAGPVPPPVSEVERLLLHAPCDVAVHVGRGRRLADAPVLVLFAGGEHDWAAAELGAWVARARGTTLRLAGPAEGDERDASRTLASASLALQRMYGLVAEPLLLPPAEDDVVAAATRNAVVVVGLPDRWRDGLGRIRTALTSMPEPPVLLVRRGLRPGGLAPRGSLTRFTWTLAGG